MPSSVMCVLQNRRASIFGQLAARAAMDSSEILHQLQFKAFNEGHTVAIADIPISLILQFCTAKLCRCERLGSFASGVSAVSVTAGQKDIFRCVRLLRNTSCCTTSSVMARRQQETSHLIRLVAALITCSTAWRVSCEHRDTDSSRSPIKPHGGGAKGVGSKAASDTLVHPSIRRTRNPLHFCRGNRTTEFVTCRQLLKSSSIRLGQLYPMLFSTDRRNIVAPSRSSCWRSSVSAILTTWSFTELRDTNTSSNFVKL
mmetsp:Transcript_35691/g.75671  ORF Transcript_35691/g.75671 Transcript_35691/m.75671 type:complete len:257 (+) Transcript_35691:956-1726(+)